MYDSVLDAFPKLRDLMNSAQAHARKYGYVTTILGRRRHISDMQLKPFEFRAMQGYVNPDIDPLDVTTLTNKSDIPDRIVKALEAEFAGYKYFGQIVKRTKELQEQKIRVINNRQRITDASRQCVNCVDLNTEILTTSGWKRHNEVAVGDTIISYSVEQNSLVWDRVVHVTKSFDSQKVIHAEGPMLSAVCTPNHRWVTSYRGAVSVQLAQHTLVDGSSYSVVAAAPCQTSHAKCQIALTDPDKLTWSAISNLSQQEAQQVLDFYHYSIGCPITFQDKERRDKMQYIAIMAGYSAAATEVHTKTSSPLYHLILSCSRTVDVSELTLTEETCQGVWCPTTEQGTWVARRNGTVYITGNSIIQGRQHCPNSLNLITQGCAI